jgi:hypothetical protein
LPYSAPISNKPSAAIREDTVMQQVFLYSFSKLEETLLYDFSLRENDTIEINKWGRKSTLIVESVTTKVIYGISRKVIVFVENGMYDPIWIGGIGSTHGLLNSDFNQGLIDAGYSLNCMHIGDSLLYMNPNIMDCNTTNVSIKQVGKLYPKIQVFHNPLRIVFHELETVNSSLKIFGLNGIQIIDIQMNGEQVFFLDGSIHKNGVYIYFFRSPNFILRGKILIFNCNYK